MLKKTQPFDARQNMSRAGFEIFHYQDPEIQEIPVHHHDFFEVYLFLGGRVDYFVEGRTYKLLPGDILLINPMELHRPLVEPGTPYERIVLWIDKDHLSSLSGDAFDLSDCFRAEGNRFHAAHTDLADKLSALAQEFSGTEYGSSVLCQGMLLQIIVELNRLVLRGEGEGASAEVNPLIPQVLDHIKAHYSEPLSLDSLAELFYVSKYHLSHLFTQTVGISVYRYILLKRLQMARELLSEGEPPGVVYRSCGFQDYANFYRAFKQLYGGTPQEAMRRRS